MVLNETTMRHDQKDKSRTNDTIALHVNESKIKQSISESDSSTASVVSEEPPNLLNQKIKSYS